MPIFPGQSLTAEPKNAPYENPPEMNDPEEITLWYLDNLSKPDKAEALLDSLELGLDVVTLTEGLLRGAVLEGRHTVDVSLLIAPVIHEFIKTSAEKAGIEFEEGFPDDSEEKNKTKYQINSRKARKMIEAAKGSDSGFPESVQDTIDSVPTESDIKKVVNKGEGLMTRTPKEVL